jgi:hypothetical protein
MICRYCPEDANEAICIGCRSKFEALEAENVRLKKDIDYLRNLAAAHRHETRADIARKMRKK